MSLVLSLALSTSPSVYLLLFLGILALLVISLLIALIEGVALTLLNWHPFRASLTVSLIMNIASGLINGLLLILLQRTPLLWLPISFVVSLLVEFFIMMYFKRAALRQNILFVVLVNLVSYLLLILPAYYYGAQSAR